jgi:hypothetical protein
LLTRINTEHEVRLVTDVRGLKAAERWFAAQPFEFRGASENFRSHYYYDLPRGMLAQKGRSFRQSVGNYAYCLKYPVRSEGIVITRREVFCKMSSPLDILHPYHQRLGILVRLLPMLSEKSATPALLKRFKPRIRMDCRRQYRIMLYPDGIDRMMAVAFDRVSAYDMERGDDRPFASWCEIELETIWAFPERTDVATDIARKLEKVGLKVTSKSKFRIASEKLLPHG